MGKRKVVLVLITAVLGLSIWYLFLKPHDYTVSIKANTFPGTINQVIKTWSKGLENSQDLQQRDLKNLSQRLSFSDSTHTYEWQIKTLTDSTSQVKVYVTDVNNSFQNRLTMPFSETDFEKRTKKTLLDFTEKLNEHIKKFKVTLMGESTIPASYCAYISLKGLQIEKARGMMRNYTMLSSFLVNSNVELKGQPIVEVTHWDQQTDSIYYNFCFPLIKTDSLPKHPFIKYKALPEQKALKAIYNGNYITSDRAWYALEDQAKKLGKEVSLPFEVFYSNPNFGGDELEWKAEIYLPLK